MNLPTPRIISAINLASNLHRDHVRKDEDKTPYVSHLFAVSMYLASVTDDEDIIIAGLMHDALEDVADYEYEDLASDCGDRVAKIVAGVTEDKSMPYKERKLDYLANLESGTVESILVSLADKIHNAKSLKHVGAEHNMNIDTQVKIYTEVLRIARQRFADLDSSHPYNNLVNKLEEVLSGFK